MDGVVIIHKRDATVSAQQPIFTEVRVRYITSSKGDLDGAPRTLHMTFFTLAFIFHTKSLKFYPLTLRSGKYRNYDASFSELSHHPVTSL